jgi:threonine synthase
MVRAWQRGERHATRWEDAHTVAAGIRVPQAVGDFLILDAVRQSNGAALAVSDAAILQAVDDAARLDGLLLCPEGAATLAAWREALASGMVSPDDKVLLFNCATGLKYPMSDQSRTLDRNGPIDFASL